MSFSDFEQFVVSHHELSNTVAAALHVFALMVSG